MFNMSPEQTKAAINKQFERLSLITEGEQIQLSFSSAGWPTTRAWIIAPQLLPHFPKFLNDVEKQLATVHTVLPSILAFFQAFDYHNDTFWVQLSSSSVENQIDHLLNCCALSVLTDHLPSSEERDTLKTLQHHISGHVLDAPQIFSTIQQLAVQLRTTLSPTSTLHEYLNEFDMAFKTQAGPFPNLLTDALKQIQELYAVKPKEEDTWAQRLLDAADHLSENIMDIFNHAMPISITTAFASTSNAPTARPLWVNTESELSVFPMENKVLIKWAGPSPLKAIAINDKPIQCSNAQAFKHGVVQYWGPIDEVIHKVQFFDGTNTFQINVQDTNPSIEE